GGAAGVREEIVIWPPKAGRRHSAAASPFASRPSFGDFLDAVLIVDDHPDPLGDLRATLHEPEFRLVLRLEGVAVSERADDEAAGLLCDMEPGQGDGVACLYLLALVHGINDYRGGVVGADAIAVEGRVMRRDLLDSSFDDEIRIGTGLGRPLGPGHGSKNQDGNGHRNGFPHRLDSSTASDCFSLPLTITGADRNIQVAITIGRRAAWSSLQGSR